MRHSSSEEESVDRRIAAEGPAAVGWMGRLGYEVAVAEASRMRAGGDAIRGRSFAVARLWHNAPRVTRQVDRTGGGAAITLVVEGSVTVTQGTTSLHIGRGEGFLDSLAASTTVDVSGSVGSIELRTDETFSRRFGVAMPVGLQPLSPALDSVPWLLALANATLASRGSRRGASWSFTRAALENLVAAVIVEENEAPPASIVDRAIEEIRRSSADPSFDVGSLAATQSITPRWLQAAFAQRGLTPRASIRLERTRAAWRIIESHRDLPLDEVARRTGFPSGRALGNALRAFDEAM